MKKKNLSQKLVLNKKTIADLENTEMKNLKGGTESDLICTLDTCTECTVKKCLTVPQISCFFPC